MLDPETGEVSVAVKLGFWISWLASSGIGTVTMTYSTVNYLDFIETYGGGEGIVSGYERELYLSAATIRADLWWRPSMRRPWRWHLKTLIPG